MKTKQRIEMRQHPADVEPSISGWAVCVQGEGEPATFILDHDYPDWQPAPGWVLACGLGVFNVVAVDGRILTVSKE